MARPPQRSRGGEWLAAILLLPAGVGAWVGAAALATSEEGSPFAIFLAAFGVLAVATAVGAARRLRREARVLRMRSRPVATAPSQPQARQRPARPASPPPPLEVEVVRASKLPAPRRRDLRPVTPTSNVLGRRPLRILHLWVFASEQRLANYLEGSWRELGVVRAFGSVAAVSGRELAEAKRTGRALFAATPAAVDQAIGKASKVEVVPKGRRRIRGSGVKVRVRDPYGAYRDHRLLFHDTTWQYALDQLLATSDLVTMDLSGFSDKRQGAEYELGRVFDLVPVDRVVFLTDPRARKRPLIAGLREAWERMAPSSPNRSAGPARCWVVRTDRLQTTASASPSATARSGPQASETKVKANRKDARRIVHALVYGGG